MILSCFASTQAILGSCVWGSRFLVHARWRWVVASGFSHLLAPLVDIGEITWWMNTESSLEGKKWSQMVAYSLCVREEGGQVYCLYVAATVMIGRWRAAMSKPVSWFSSSWEHHSLEAFSPPAPAPGPGWSPSFRNNLRFSSKGRSLSDPLGTVLAAATT